MCYTGSAAHIMTEKLDPSKPTSRKCKIRGCTNLCPKYKQFCSDLCRKKSRAITHRLKRQRLRILYPEKYKELNRAAAKRHRKRNAEYIRKIRGNKCRDCGTESD